ncbi:hypothetical protein IIA15_00185 [candidate division TA06 bacterium]|nr:hypothetical protein [candidate division TA06 bacterium]
MIEIYQGSSNQDLFIAQWWAKIQTNGELKMTFSSNCYALSGFFSLFQKPNVLTFDVDQKGLWFAAWFEPVMSSAFMGLWVDKRKRGTISSWKNFERVVSEGLSNFSSIMGVTKQEKLVAQHKKIGYTELGVIPGIFDGEDGFILLLTKEAWERRSIGKTRKQEVAIASGGV